MNKNLLKTIGIVAVGLGSAALYLGGSDSNTVIAIVGAVFTLAGLIAGAFEVKEKK